MASKRLFSLFLRLFVLSALVLLCLGLSVPLLTPGPAAQETGRKIWLGDSQPLTVTYTDANGTAAAMATGVFEGVTPQPVAMAKGDFDQDGIGDLAVGFSTGAGGFIAIHRGNLDAFAPQSQASYQAIAHNQFVSPFVSQAQTFPVSVSPDFVAAGDFTGHGHTDLAVASRGGSTLYVFAGDGKSHFTAGQTINLPGGVTGLSAGGLGRPEPVSNLLVGISSPQATFLAVYGVGTQGMAPIAAFPLNAPATSFDFGEFGDGARQDAAFLSGGQVFILRSSTMQLSHVSLPVSATAFALGSFVFDRNAGSQIAVLGSDGSVQIAARSEFDPRVYTPDEFRAIRQAIRNEQIPPLVPAASFPANGWKIVESFPAVGAVSSGQTPVFLRARVSNQGGDDIMWLRPNGQMAVISHANVVPGSSTFIPGELSLKPYSGSPVAAISTRVNVDGRPGILALHQGQTAIHASMPLPDPTFFVNRTDDPTPTSPIANACNNVSAADTSSSCSLREAVLKANGDTIMLQANTTYTLTLAKVANDCTGNHGALSAEKSVTIVGGSQSTTIVQAGTTQATGVDMVMNVNEDLGTANCPQTNSTVSISNLTLQNGHNNGTHGNDGDGGCMEFDTGTSGNAALSLTNVTLNNCTTTQGNGGGIAIFNFVTPGGTGAVTISNSIIQNNSASDSVTVGTGGGIWVSINSRLTMANSQVTNNQATQVHSGAAGTGGGITTTSNVSGSPQVVIHGSTISNNQASGNGGGLNVETNLLIDSSSVINGNSAGSSNLANSVNGGGIFADLVSPDSVTLTKVTITGNSAANGAGGGIFNGSNSGGGAMTISFSRLAGNSAGTANTANLNNDDTSITATNNWWGTNTPSGTITTAGAGGSTTFDPFIVLTHTASPNKIRINQSTTLTGDMSNDNHGSSAALSGNEDEIVGLPITFNNAVLGTIPQAQPETLGNPTPTATATYNAGGVGGNGSADATVDQQTVTASIIVLQPPSMTKTFSPKTIQTTAGTGVTVSTITFKITNGNTVPINVNFTDTLPANVGTVPGSLVVATTPNVVSTCGTGTTATAGSGAISFSNNSVAVGTCTVKVDVQSAVDNIYSNSVTVDSTDAGNGNTSSDTLNVINPPHIAKAFGASTIPLNGATSLTFTVSNTNQNQTLSGISFTDTLPNAAPGTLVVATPNGLTNTCSTTPTAAAGSGSISLSGASLAPGASCTITVNVQGTVAGAANNSVTASDTTAGTGNTGTANLTVVAPPTISKAFGAASIPLNGTTSLTFTITNPNTGITLNGIAFSDTVPANLKMIGFGSAGDTCNGVTSPGSSTVNYSGISLAANSSCTLTVTVKGIAAGNALNTTSAITSTEGGTGTTSNTATLTVVAPPTISKAFGAATIPLNGTTTVTFTITNPAANTVAENGVAFSDTLTNGLQVASTPGVSNTCGGTVTATANSTSISLAGGSIATPGASCTIVVNVTGTQSGNNIPNTTAPVSSTNGGTGATSNTATLTVASPPTISKAFGATTIPLNGTTSVTFTINNPNSNVTLNGVAFTDNLPAGLVVAPTPNVNNTCSGSVTATAGSSSISLSGGVVNQAASCALSVDVQGTTAGAKLNTTGAISSTEGGTGTASNTASLTVSQATTSTTVSSSSNPSVFGQSVTFTATVTDTSAGSNAQPTGSVQFVVDGVNFGSPVALAGASSNSSTATSQAIATLSVGGSPHTVQANYVNADGNFSNSSGQLSGGQAVTAAITSAAVVSSSNPSTFGQPVTFTATVNDISAGSTAQPTGSVQFVVDGVNFGSPVTLTGASSNSSAATSQATATLSIAGSPHSVTANYVNADGNFTNSSAILAGGQVVTKANTTTTVTSSQGTITLGDTVTFTATVTVNAPATGTATGLVTFFDGSTPIAAGVLNQANPDQATFATSLLAVGSHSITAIYNGDADFSTSPLSSPATETVNLRASTASVALNPTTVGAGQASTATVTLTDGGASTPPGTPDVFSATGAPATGRTGFTSTLFADGLVLVAGGTGADGITVLKSAEIYSVSGGAFSATGSLNTARTGAVAVLLPNGKVLVAGGSGDGTAGGALNSAELFDPSAGTFTPTGHNMTAARFGTTATLLNTGKVLLAGGANNTGVVNSAELYDPATDTFTATGNLNSARTGASATLLGTGKVLVAGGSSDGTANGALSSAEVFDPAGNSGAGAFNTVAGANPALAAARWQPEAALLSSGKVLIAGGQDGGGVLTSADLYDPVADSFTASAHPMNEARANGSAVALPNGMVLLSGGTTSQAVDIYDADGDKFNPTGSLLQFDNGLVATLLNNGRVLVVGLTNAVTPASDAELYSPSFNPLGTVGLSSSEPTDVFGAACVLTPSTSTASTCISTVTPTQVATSPHTITGTYPADAVHSGSSNTASLTVIPTAPPTIAKAFSAGNVAQNGIVNVSFTIVNPNPAATLTGISFTDALPAGLTVASPNNLNSNCGGAFTAVAGSSAISLTGGSLAPPGPPPPIAARRAASRRQTTPSTPAASGQCVITVDLLVTGTGTISNTTGPVSANESGPGNPSNTASFNVVFAPTANKAFGASSIPLNGTTSLTFNLANPNTAIGLFNSALTDALPNGLVVANPNGLAGSCVASSVIAATPGSNSISLSGLSLPAAGSCSFSVNVTGAAGGVKNNVTAPVAATFDDGTGTFVKITGGSASASLTVLAPDLTIAKSHSGNFTQGDVGDTYQITVSNAGTVPTAGTVSVTDAAPSFLIPTAMSGTGWTCTLGTLSCTRSDVLAASGSYPPITLTTSVAINAPPTLTNTATVSGGGETNTANDTASDTTTINPLPGPPLTITLLVPSTQTIKNGNNATFVFDVVSHSALLGNINFNCQGLPAKTACSFSPQSENQGDAQVTMTMTTTADTASAAPAGRKGGPVYAALFFPVLGLLSLAVAGRRGKKNRMRLLMFLGSVVVLLALFGCGGTPHNGTPPGAFPITVTATSAANPTVTASTQVVVTVQ